MGEEAHKNTPTSGPDLSHLVDVGVSGMVEMSPADISPAVDVAAKFLPAHTPSPIESSTLEEALCSELHSRTGSGSEAWGHGLESGRSGEAATTSSKKSEGGFKVPAPRHKPAATSELATASDVSQPSSSGVAASAPQKSASQMPPPPPSFSSKASSAAVASTGVPGQWQAPEDSVQGTSESSEARAAAIRAAALAAQHATPAQRERMVAAAATAAMAEQEAVQRSTADAEANGKRERSAVPAGPPREAAQYQPPPWAGVPEGVGYTLEVMKNGTIIGTRPVDAKDHYTFGRTPDNDIVLEHPSSSRLHAVLQHRGDSKEAFICDTGSVHGTFLNKRQLKPNAFVPLRVGDILKFGQSTRLYILGGPTELMPEEGLTKKQRQELVALEAREARKEREAQIAKAQMDAALAEGVGWGMSGPDAEVDPDDDNAAAHVDWRAFAATQPLTDRQRGLADKIRKREARVANLRKECERIEAKQRAGEELTMGQADTLARNERVIDATNAELEDLEEMLSESIADAIAGRKRKAEEAVAEVGKPERKKRRRGSDDEDDDDDDDDDAFYDRTRTDRRRAAGKKAAAAAVVEDAASLYGKKEALLAEKARLEQAIAIEEGSLPTAQEDTAAAAAPSVEGRNPRAPLVVAGGGGPEGPEADPLDEYMSSVAAAVAADGAQRLRKELKEVETQLEEASRLLKIADPDNYYRPGSKLAEAAKARGIKALRVEKARQEAAERQKAREEAEKAAAEAAFIPEEEDEEPAPAPVPSAASLSVHRLDPSAGAPAKVGLEIRKKPPPAAVAGAEAGGNAPMDVDAAAAGGADDSAREASSKARRAQVAAALAGQAGGEARPLSKDIQAAAAAQVRANLQRLSTARRGGAAEDEPAGAESAGGAAEQQATEQWKPPEGQTGDGRSRLNDLLGY